MPEWRMSQIMHKGGGSTEARVNEIAPKGAWI